MTLVTGLHHVGLNVADLDSAVVRVGAAGFAAGPVLHLTDPSAARGNGLETIDMRVCFVANGRATIELLEHRGPALVDPTGDDHAGDVEWLLPGDGTTVPVDLPGVTSAVRPGPFDLRWSSRDVEATGAILDSLGLDRRVEEGVEASCWVVGEGTLRLGPTDDRTTPPPADTVGRPHLALRVSDAERAHDLLGAAGHRCWTSPIPHEGVLSWFFVRDPGGVALEIVQDDTGT